MNSKIPSHQVDSLVGVHKLTLVLLSYERQNFVRRQLLYYSSRPVHIVIADGSATPWQDGVRGSSGDMTWEYLHVPGYYTYRDRLALALERVETEYVCLVEDQECILWTGLQAAVRTLDALPDHVCAGGLVAIAHAKPKETVLYPWKHTANLSDLTHPDPIERFRKITGPDHYSANLYYQVTRTSNFRKFAQMMRGFEGDSLATPEVALAGYLALAGKWAMGLYPYWIRAGGTLPIPVDAIMIISPVEIEEICSKLLDLLNQDGASGVKSPSSDYLSELCGAIERGWGESSQWAIESPVYVKNRQSNSKHVNMSQIARNIRSCVVAMLRKRAPRIYCLMRPNSTLALLPPLGFLDYARTHAPGSYEVANDILTLSEIWQSCHDGVSQDSLG